MKPENVTPLFMKLTYRKVCMYGRAPYDARASHNHATALTAVYKGGIAQAFDTVDGDPGTAVPIPSETALDDFYKEGLAHDHDQGIALVFRKGFYAGLSRVGYAPGILSDGVARMKPLTWTRCTRVRSRWATLKDLKRCTSQGYYAGKGVSITATTQLTGVVIGQTAPPVTPILTRPELR